MRVARAFAESNGFSGSRHQSETIERSSIDSRVTNRFTECDLRNPVNSAYALGGNFATNWIIASIPSKSGVVRTTLCSLLGKWRWDNFSWNYRLNISMTWDNITARFSWKTSQETIVTGHEEFFINRNKRFNYLRKALELNFLFSTAATRFVGVKETAESEAHKQKNSIKPPQNCVRKMLLKNRTTFKSRSDLVESRGLFGFLRSRHGQLKRILIDFLALFSIPFN